jgi:hypothetical protein
LVPSIEGQEELQWFYLWTVVLLHGLSLHS